MLQSPSTLLRAPHLARAVAMPTALSRGVAPITSRLNSSSSTNAPPKNDDAPAGSSTEKDAAQPTSTASGPSTEQPTETEPKRKLTIAEQDALAFRQLDDREGSGAGNEILDGEYEKGMTRNTRKNQYRVI